jgi:hypothetical protein
MNADLSKKLLKFHSESALIVHPARARGMAGHRRFKGSKSKRAKVPIKRNASLSSVMQANVNVRLLSKLVRA